MGCGLENIAKPNILVIIFFGWSFLAKWKWIFDRPLSQAWNRPKKLSWNDPKKIKNKKIFWQNRTIGGKQENFPLIFSVKAEKFSKFLRDFPPKVFSSAKCRETFCKGGKVLGIL